MSLKNDFPEVFSLPDESQFSPDPVRDWARIERRRKELKQEMEERLWMEFNISESDFETLRDNAITAMGEQDMQPTEFGEVQVIPKTNFVMKRGRADEHFGKKLYLNMRRVKNDIPS